VGNFFILLSIVSMPLRQRAHLCFRQTPFGKQTCASVSQPAHPLQGKAQPGTRALHNDNQTILAKFRSTGSGKPQTCHTAAPGSAAQGSDPRRWGKQLLHKSAKLLYGPHI
jgi:hypothetical protein